MNKRPGSAYLRRQCFNAHKIFSQLTGKWLLQCHICGFEFDPTRTRWDAEHVVRRVLTGDDSPANVLPAHATCHKPKTVADVRENAKGKRVSDRHYNIRQSSGFGWTKRFKKKLNGEVVER